MSSNDSATIKLADYLSAAQHVDLDGKGNYKRGVDCTSEFETALHAAQRQGKALDIGDLKILLSGRTITPLPGDLTIKGTLGSCAVYVKGWKKKKKTNIYVKCGTLFQWHSEKKELNPPNTARIEFNGLTFHNLEPSITSRIVSCPSTGDSYTVIGWRSYGFTSAHAYGRALVDISVAGRQYEQQYTKPAWKHSKFDDYIVESDRHRSRQCGCFIHAIQASDFYLGKGRVAKYNNDKGTANGYCVRVTGGLTATVPRPVSEGGVGNIHISDGYSYYTENERVEANQLAKIHGFTIGKFNGDASNGFEVDNAWDLYNCFDGTVNAGTVIGSGICFFGHSDMNHSKHAKYVKGPSGLKVTGGTCIDCEHSSVFNIGGDGVVGAHRQASDVHISGVKYYDRPHFQKRLAKKYRDRNLKQKAPYKKRAFVDAFITNGLDIVGNNVSDLEVILKTYYVRHAFVGGGNCFQSPEDRPMSEWVSKGSDGSTKPTYADNKFVNRGGGFNKLFKGRAKRMKVSLNARQPMYLGHFSDVETRPVSRTLNFVLPAFQHSLTRVDLVRIGHDKTAKHYSYHIATDRQGTLVHEWLGADADDRSWQFMLEVDRRLTVVDNAAAGHSGWYATLTPVRL